jgi:hypothetical protein
MGLAADGTSLSARTSAPATCLNVTRICTASRIWELPINVKTNLRRSTFGVPRSKFGGMSFAVERRTLNAERGTLPYPEWERIFDKNCWARSVPGELKKSALDRSSTISP